MLIRQLLVLPLQSLRFSCKSMRQFNLVYRPQCKGTRAPASLALSSCALWVSSLLLRSYACLSCSALSCAFMSSNSFAILLFSSEAAVSSLRTLAAF